MYDITSIIESLENKYHHAIPVLGGARFAIEHTNNIEKFIHYLPTVINNARFFNWHEGAAGACRTFCHLCLIDPMLIEVYIGMTFEELCKN